MTFDLLQVVTPQLVAIDHSESVPNLRPALGGGREGGREGRRERRRDEGRKREREGERERKRKREGETCTCTCRLRVAWEHRVSQLTTSQNSLQTFLLMN